MTLRDQISADSELVFLRTDDFAESITYHPHQGHGESAPVDRSIDAQVFRQTITVMQKVGEVEVQACEVHVDNDATSGISSAELDLGGDQITLSVRNGEAAERRSIVDIVSQDHAMLVLLVY